MKNTIILFLIIILFSSCTTLLTKFGSNDYTLNKGKIDIPKKDHYIVLYKANFAEGLKAMISYTDENDKQIELKDVTGNWEKSVVIKSGSKVIFDTIAKGSAGKGEYAVLVDEKIISEYILSNRKLHYQLNFDLP
ncbi:hypothetical protein [Pedobacter punctiformis]|uniref:Lipoprotein n=1 Tax=Pedobacter punctiformis TaxID=3004097 RepID=A0ABT4LBT3_9SPHI|nr:hypothetical protein [Pedobacter sp. HCMS5-2]MCZ4245376.1 hypothetical protein [Pedobacter sp. HCMS5-2]